MTGKPEVLSQAKAWFSRSFFPEKRKTFMGCLILLPLLFICGYWLQ